MKVLFELEVVGRDGDKVLVTTDLRNTVKHCNRLGYLILTVDLRPFWGLCGRCGALITEEEYQGSHITGARSQQCATCDNPFRAPLSEEDGE